MHQVTSLWEEYFAAYSRREKEELGTQRQAARNSLVGSGALTAATRGPGGSGARPAAGEDADGLESQQQQGGQKGGQKGAKLEESGDGKAATNLARIGDEEVPACPPVSEFVSLCSEQMNGWKSEEVGLGRSDA